MSDESKCDFCGCSERDLKSHGIKRSPVIEIDQDGLWVCSNCRPKLLTPAGGDDTSDQGELRELIGKSAGAICYTLNLPYEPPYQHVIDSAARIAYDEDRYMSTWSFVTQWLGGTSVWRSPGGEASALVTPDGSIQIRSNNSS